MTKRTTQFPAIPTGPLKTLQEKTNPEPQQTQTNPLAAFFRKSKLSLSLPSHGKWYPKNSVTYDATGRLPVFAMNATDDIKIRTGDATMTGKNIYDVVKSCIPNISQPNLIPHVDLDAILLAIRVASYGPEFDFIVSVPHTTLTRTIKLDATKLLNDVAMRTDLWDEEINIEDETTGQTLSLTVQPIPLENLFTTSKNIFILRRALSKNFDQNENIKDESGFSKDLNAMAIEAIDLLCSSIKTLKIFDKSNSILLSLDAVNPQDIAQIKQTIHQIGVEYFNSIRDHIDAQRQKYVFLSPEQTSTQKEIEAGAPEKWTTELIFMGSNFLPELKNLQNIV